jgi:MerR family transcriptional regulator, light-induced transcriptional regulator
MGQYSIKQLETISGIKAHTIRIWEKRYALMTPLRTNTNIRYYSDDHLKKILNIALLINGGHKISKVAPLSDKELNKLVSSDFVGSCSTELVEKHINAMLLAMIDYDENYFEKIFSDSVLQLGFRETIAELIYPFLVRIGLMWGINEANPAQEHFISNLIRQKIIVAINSIALNTGYDRIFVLFLPEGELQEIGLLVSYYLTKANGHKVIYLGQNVPLKDVLDVIECCAPTDILTILTNPYFTKIDSRAYFDGLSASSSKIRVYVSCSEFAKKMINISDKVNCVSSLKDFEKVI